MRPVRLDLAGFTTFRSLDEPIDFSDADLFALTGPTGSGKSSIVDAMCFALYGSIPRLDKAKVEPVISLGAQEARIRFDFTVDGAPFTAVRRVVRTKTGATTAEARLEGGPEVISGADQVTEAVETLLGLPFEDFTKSVVLPQGEFAAFLHDKPARRQDLLRRLLDLGVYERMRSIAQSRTAALEAEASWAERQVVESPAADPDVERRARRRADALAELRTTVEGARPEMARLAAVAEEAVRSDSELAKTKELLETVRQPTEVDSISRRTSNAAEALERARRAALEVGRALEQAERALADLGDPLGLAETIRLHDSRSEIEGRLAKGSELVARSESDLASAVRSLAEASERRLAAVDRERRVRTLHAAHAIRSDLDDGDECPVCLRTVDVVPRFDPPEALERLERERISAEENERTATAERERISTVLDSYRLRLDDLRGELATVARALEDRPDLDGARLAMGRIEEAKAERDRLLAGDRAARASVEQAERALDDTRRHEHEAWVAFDRVRDTVAGLAPPAVERHDLLGSWRALTEWAVGLTETVIGDRTRARVAADEAKRALDALVVELVARATEHGIETGPDRLHDDVIVASVEAAAVVERIEEAKERARALRMESEQRRSDAQMMRTLTRHLSATGFQSWILEEAFLGLVTTANEMLDQLSGGAYSLHVARRDFVVVDHRNADETRSVKTLSGGETFLVSLSLALALAEQLSLLGGSGGARLESMFLDEGFGALDTETLETVAAVIQELGATGRTVGIITHVTELAEQVPVRYEVRKLPGGSVVRKVVT